jgi:hypothetical protein
MKPEVDRKHQMRRATRIKVPLQDWPEDDRDRWNAAFKVGDPFDDCGLAAHLADRTRQDIRYNYECFLGFLTAQYPDLMRRPPAERPSPAIIAQYTIMLRQSCGETTVASYLHKLRFGLRCLCPTTDWSWLSAIAKRIAAQATRRPERHHLVTSDQLYALGITLMDQATTTITDHNKISKAQAFKYRDGLIIALLALIPLRRRTLAALRIEKHLVKSGQQWALDIPAEDTKTRRALDYPVSPELSARIDAYLSLFRPRIPSANTQSRSSDGPRVYLSGRRATYQESTGLRDQSAPLPPCGSNPMVHSRSCQRAGCQRPLGPSIIWND